MKTALLLAFIASTALSTGALAQSTTGGTATDSGATGTGATTGTGAAPATTTGTGTSSGTSSSTGSNTGSGSTIGTGSDTSNSTGNGTGGSSAAASGSSSGSATPGSQSPNPNVYGNSSGGSQWNQGGWGGGFNMGYAGPPMMQGMMTCVSPAPMGGFGSFACYPAGWGMGGRMGGGMGGGMDMGGMDGMGWHHRNHGQWGMGGDGSYSPNDYYQDRQTYRGKRDRSRVPGSDNTGGSPEEGYDNDWRSDGSGYDGNGSDDYSNQ